MHRIGRRLTKGYTGVTLTRGQWQTGLAIVVELVLICSWALWVGRAYLNLDPRIVPDGREFAMAIEPQFVWENLAKCGVCMLWNGLVNGGNPAFVELHGIVLHPLAILGTLAWGPVDAAKVLVVASLALAGVAQWWLACVLRLGRVARLWCAAMAVTGGHLAGRMELGVVGVVLSTASVSMVLAPALDLALHGRRRSTLLLAVTTALAVVSGQGYMQLGLIFSLVPALLILLLDHRFRPRPVWKEFVLAGGLALLLAGVFLVPLLHFWPNFSKEIDPSLQSVQPLEYTPLNLVIRELSFYRAPDILYKQPYPYLYVNYISWVPILLAAAALRLVPRQQLRVLAFLLVMLGLVYVCASGITIRLLERVFPTFAAGIRNPPLIAGLAVPCVLALGAWGLDLLLGLNWPSIGLAISRDSAAQMMGRFSLAWIILGVPLVWGLVSSYTFNQGWLGTAKLDAQVDIVKHAMVPASTEWVEAPFGEHYWTPPFFADGMKITNFVHAWSWRDRPNPLPFFRATRDVKATTNPGYVTSIDGVHVLTLQQNAYAYVETTTARVPCVAQATGGNIDVTCTTTAPGRLIVQENSWSGWSVQRDGGSTALAADRWLSVTAPAGHHQYTFRYRPWDVLLGLSLTLVGMIVTVGLWWHAGKCTKDVKTASEPV